jgi:hypothetical protein
MIRLILFRICLKKIDLCKALDYCEIEKGHEKCGTNGVCRNDLLRGGFKCDCHLFFEGDFCNSCKLKLCIK